MDHSYTAPAAHNEIVIDSTDTDKSTDSGDPLPLSSPNSSLVPVNHQLNPTEVLAKCFLQNQPLRRAAIEATTGIAELVSELKDSIKVVNAAADPGKCAEVTLAVADLVKTDTLTSMGRAHEILAVNEGKVIDYLSSQATGSSPATHHSTGSSATDEDESLAEYRFTFAIKDVLPDQVVVPLAEVMSMMEGCKFQVLKEYSSSNGHVIIVQTLGMYRVMKTRIPHHITAKGIPLTDTFNITSVVKSDFAVKTDHVSRSDFIHHYKLVTDGSDRPSPCEKKIKALLLKYNNSWFPTPQDIGLIEVYGFDKKSHDATVTIKIHVSRRTYIKFLSSRTTTILFQDKTLWVWEEVRIDQCTQCCGLGHNRLTCSNKPRCRFCGFEGNPKTTGHYSKSCKFAKKPTCFVCLGAVADDDSEANEKGIAHHACSFACPALRLETNRVRKELKDHYISQDDPSSW